MCVCVSVVFVYIYIYMYDIPGIHLTYTFQMYTIVFENIIDF